jgi:hypothetical protein
MVGRTAAGTVARAAVVKAAGTVAVAGDRDHHGLEEQ